MKLKPRCPVRSCESRAWRIYYEKMAMWFADHAINLVNYPRASEHAQGEAERFCKGARELREGRHVNQISGVWR